MPEQELPKGFDTRQRGWYKKALENKGSIIVTDPYKDALDNKKYDVTFAKTVEDTSGNIVGVIGIDIALDKLSKKVSDITIGQEGYALIIDSTGSIIAHKDSERVGMTSKEDKVIEEVLNNKNKVFEQDIDNEIFIVLKRVDENTGYTILGLVPKKELTSKVNGVVLINIISAIALLTIAVIIASKFTKVKIINPIKMTVDALEEMSNGNFTIRVEKTKSMTTESEDIVDAINNTVMKVANILRSVDDASNHLKESSESLLSITEESSAIGDEVATSVQQIADGAIHQSEMLSDSSNIAEGLGEKVEVSIQNSKYMMSAAKEAKQSSNEGAMLVSNLTEAFDNMYTANLDVVEKVQQLEVKSNEIGAITDVMKGITEQTNLLALNVSIEVVRAGEAGRGFAIVAEEVRKLAKQSSDSALKIEKVILEVKSSVSGVFEKLKLSKELSDKTAINVHATNTSFKLIEETIEKLESNIETVTNSLEGIREDKDEVITNISEVSTVAQESAATSEEVSVSSEEQASGLQEIVTSAEKLTTLLEESKDIICKFKI